MLDFSILQNSSEHPTFMSILLTVLFSFALSSLIVLTYDMTTKAIKRPLHFMQSLAMISIVAATVMQAVGDSLARGLGMLGALAIIRFRTSIRNTRNITFMFASLAVGIACGVNGYEIAITGTIVFCSVAFLLRISPFHDDKKLIGHLRFFVLQTMIDHDKIEDIVKNNSDEYELTLYKFDTKTETKEPTEGVEGAVPIKTKIEIIELKYEIRVKDLKESANLVNKLSELEGVSSIRLSFNEATTVL